MDPQWLVNILKAVVTIKDVPGITGGWLSHNQPTLKSIWPKCKPSMHSFLLGLLYRFRIAIESKGQSLIPCRLEPAPSRLADECGYLLLQLEFTQILPEDLFPTFIASPKIYQYIDLKNNQIWKDAVILEAEEKEKEKVFVRSIGKSIQLFGEGPSSLLVDVASIISRTVLQSWPG
jgi:hypothetical protein